MRFKLLLLSVIGMLSLIFFSLSSANAADFGLVGGFTFSKPSFTNAGSAVTTSSINGSTYGAYLVFGLIPRLDLEFEGLYQTSKFHADTVGANPAFDSTLKSMTVPVLFRIDITRYFNIGAGGYYSQGVGNVENNVAGIVTQSSYADADFSKTDYGAVGSVQFLLPLSFRTALVVEGKYFYGTKNISTLSGEEIKTRTIDALAGLNFML